MKTMFEMVREFHEVFGARISDIPMLPDSTERALRMELLREEYEDEYIPAEKNDDLLEIADSLGDIIYIACGTAVSYGIPLDEIFAEIHRSNMDKTCSTMEEAQRSVASYEESGVQTYIEERHGRYVILRSSDSKILKRHGWQPPKIAEILAKYQTK